ncbi:MAG: cupin domain-containing protein [Clostridia bacterium]|nr:cupin domain-containing protein [Clostridia bacterium]
MFVKNSDIPLTELGGGVSRKVLAYNDAEMAVEVRFEAGAVGAVHSHPHVQISYVLHGRFEANIGGEVRIIEKGDTYITEPNVPHGVVCLEAGALLDVFTPMRADFVNKK